MNRRFSTISLLLCILAAMGTRADAQKILNAFTYQGRLTDSSGKTVADGNYSMTAKLYTVASGLYLPAWTSSTYLASVKGGLFTLSLAPPASVFENPSLWLEISVGSTTMTPRTKLNYAPFAFRADAASIADTVLDGAITLDKLAPSVLIPRVPYQTGVRSGLQTNYTLAFYLDNVALNPQAVLAAPRGEAWEVIEYQDGEDRILRKRPGRLKAGNLMIRRPLSTDRTLQQWAKTVIDGAVVRRTVAMAMMSGTTEVARWTFSNAWPADYTILLADDGLPIEQVKLVTEGACTRTVNSTAAGRPTGSGTQVGFTSGRAATDAYRVTAGVTNPDDVAVTSDSGVTTDAVEYQDATDGSLRKRPGATKMVSLSLSQNPLSRSSLYSWYHGIAGSTVDRHDVSLGVVGTSSTLAIATYSHVWPYSYTISLADDGQIIEEFDLTEEQIVFP